MTKQSIKIGAILRIDLGNGFFSYARILSKSNYAFYDSISKEEKDISEIIKLPILFIISVYKDVITRGRWKIIGLIPLESSLEIMPLEFIQNLSNPNSFELYDPNTGKIWKADRKECLGLERAAVWEATHVEERIRDHYNGVPNRWVEQMKIK